MKQLLPFFMLCVFAVGMVCAQGRKEPRKSEKPKSETTLQDVKDGANRVLEDIDQAVHQAIPKAKKTGNEALDVMEKGVKRALDSEK